MWYRCTDCTAINDLSLNRNSKDNEKFDRWVKWVGNEIRVKFCLSENEMCVYGILDVHMAWKIENRMPHFLRMPSFAYICHFTYVEVSKKTINLHTNKKISEFKSTGSVQYYKFIRRLIIFEFSFG